MVVERKLPHSRSRAFTSRPAPTNLPRGPSSQPSQTVTPAENQVVKHMSLWGQFTFKPQRWGKLGSIVPRVEQCSCLTISSVVQTSGILSSGTHTLVNGHLEPRSQRGQKPSADRACLRRSQEVISLDHLGQQAALAACVSGVGCCGERSFENETK